MTRLMAKGCGVAQGHEPQRCAVGRGRRCGADVGWGTAKAAGHHHPDCPRIAGPPDQIRADPGAAAQIGEKVGGERQIKQRHKVRRGDRGLGCQRMAGVQHDMQGRCERGHKAEIGREYHAYTSRLHPAERREVPRRSRPDPVLVAGTPPSGAGRESCGGRGSAAFARKSPSIRWTAGHAPCR